MTPELKGKHASLGLNLSSRVLTCPDDCLISPGSQSRDYEP
ncbi:Pantothenate transporter [Venturia inaequalis]|nr:Pantothenate transporter [Venturia inaequalis]